MTCKNLSGMLHQAYNIKVMSNLLLLQIWTLYVFPNKSYNALKWQIWKCELGWFSLTLKHTINAVSYSKNLIE